MKDETYMTVHIRPDGTFTLDGKEHEPDWSSEWANRELRPRSATIYDANPPPRWKFWRRRMKPIHIEFEETP